MPFTPQNFQDQKPPPVKAVWLNAIDVFVNSLCAGATTISQLVALFFPSIYQYINPQTAAESAASVMPSNYAYAPFDVRRYYSGSGTYDAAVISAIAVAVANNGGRIRFPAGAYPLANQINIASHWSIIFDGDGPPTSAATAGTVLTYTGTASPWITTTGSSGIVFSNMKLTHSNAGFTGTYWKTGTQTAYCSLSNVSMGSSVSGTVHLDLDKSLDCSFEKTAFLFGNPSVKGQAVTGGSYSNGMSFRDCWWSGGYAAALASLYYGGQAWTFDGCNFEALTGGASASTAPIGALACNSSTLCQGMTFKNCWFGDGGTSAPASQWINYYGQGLDVSGCFMGGSSSGGSPNSYAILLNGTSGAGVCGGVSIHGNYFSGFLAVLGFATSAGTIEAVDISGNWADAATTNFFGSVANAPSNLTYGPNWWNGAVVVPPSGALFGKSSANGYRVDASGIIEQWGTVAVTVGTPATVTFATNGVAFPTACWNVTAGVGAASGTNDTVDFGAPSTTSVVFNLRGTAGNTATIHWRAIGI